MTNETSLAAAFAAQLTCCQGHFDQVVFAVLDRQHGAPTHAAFTSALTLRAGR